MTFNHQSEKEGRQIFKEKTKEREQQILKEGVGSFYKNENEYLI